MGSKVERSDRWKRMLFIAAFILVILSLTRLFSGVFEPDESEIKGRVAMSFGGSTIALWNDITEIMREDLDERGYKLITHDPQFRVDLQISDWRSWIAQRRVDAIMGFPINIDAMPPITRRANEAGVPVVGYAASWEGVQAAMLTDPVEDGRSLATDVSVWIRSNVDIDTPFNVAVMTDDSGELSRQRGEGIITGIEQNFPNAKIFRVTAATREAGYTAAKQHLVSNPETAIWLSFVNDNLKGAYKALLDSGVSPTDPNYLLAGMDVTNEDLDLIETPNSIYRMALAFRSKAIAEANVNLLIGAAEGREVEDIYVRPEKVTPDNASEFRIAD